MVRTEKTRKDSRKGSEIGGALDAGGPMMGWNSRNLNVNWIISKLLGPIFFRVSRFGFDGEGCFVDGKLPVIGRIVGVMIRSLIAPEKNLSD